MPSPVPLRLVVSRAEVPFRIDPSLAFRPAPPLAPRPRAWPLLAAVAAALAVHAGALVWMAARADDDDTARSAGMADDLVLIEGIPVELIESLPTPEAPPTEAAVEPEAPADVPPDELVEVPEVPDETAEPPPEPVSEPVEEPSAEPAPDAETPSEPVDEALPPAEAETGALPARPETPPPTLEPPPQETAEDAPPEDAAEGAAPDPETVPPPRPRPEVAETPPEPKPVAPAKPSAPPPSAPSAASSAARSGGAGGGGAAQTAGTAAANAYRAEVAAQLARKKFYPNAARRDRLTGQATVRFSLNAAGRVTTVNVVRSAGSRILDDAALEMVRRAAPYPPIPRGLGSSITIQAPIGFALPR